LSGEKQRFTVEVEPIPGGSAGVEVGLRFGLRGVSAGTDEFGGVRRLPSGEWVEIDGVRVRVSSLDDAGDDAAAHTADWTKPELLISTPGNGRVRRLRLVLPVEDGTDVLVGRSGRKNDVILEDDHVSRRHVRIVVRGGRHVLEDLGSRWGTFVNGERVDGPMPLAHGDEILAGKSVMRFVKFSDGFDSAPGSTASVASRAAQARASWRPDPTAEDAGMTFSATTLLSMPPSQASERPPSSHGVSEPPEDAASISQKLTGWMRKKER
jgi:FHA domain-containing protein